VRSLRALAFLAPLLGGPAAHAEEESRLRTLDYSPGMVVPVTGFVGYHIHFEFAPDERFVTLGAGDTSLVDVGSEANHLLLKPRQATTGTNLTILTNRRAYFIDFRALARAPRAGELVYSVTFRYPLEARGDGVPRPPDAGRELGALPRAINRDYWFCGNPALRPSSAADDGSQVRLTFPSRMELPAIYAAAADGSESLVNSHVEEDTIVLHRVAARFVLRRGRLVGCLVNRAADDNVPRIRSGTVQPSIERTTREVEP
jgi:type IV secretion system protein VirB9